MYKFLRKKSCIFIVLILLAGLMLSACGSNQPAEEAGKSDQTNEVKTNEESNEAQSSIEEKYFGEEGKIVVYISGPEKMVKKLEEEFEAERGDVSDFLHMGCGPLRQKVWTEKEAGEIQADVVWGSDPLMYIALAEEGYLHKYVPKEYDGIKAEYQIGDGYYTLASERYGVIIYNKNNVNEAPKSFEDLKNKAWNSSVIMADATQSSTALALNSALYQMSGSNFDYLKALFDNKLFLTKKNGEVSSKIAEGEFDGGIAPHDGVLRLKKKAKKEGYEMPIDITWPKEGALAIQRPIAIVENKARPEVNDKLAKEFVDFILSKKAQSITTQFGFVSVRQDIELPNGIPKELKILAVDWQFASDHEEEIRDGFKNVAQGK
ncbi:MAG: extracellular solute-binding protein [Maledivibacter sp.]|jgi:iron(III) transport system substrate-binding protein|nr:extracellular solute-binding protein [Maledivibacter sp.]